MTQELLKKVLFTLTIVFGLAQTQAQVFDFEADNGGWIAEFQMASAELDATTGRNTLKCVRENNNATLALDPVVATIDPTTKNYLRLVIKNESNANSLRVKAVTTDNSDNSMQFAITANDTDFKTYAFELDSYDTWADATTTTEEVRLLFRAGYDMAEGNLYIDEIEFFTATATYDGILQNASFDDFGGTIDPWNPANKPYATVDISTDYARTGSTSMKHEYTDVPNNTHFVFNNYIHDLGASTSDDVTASIWVKVVRPSTPGVSPLITVQGQARTGTTLVVNELTTSSQNKPTTMTDGTWEEIVYTYSPADAYSTAQFRYGILMTNLEAGDIVYVDDLSAETTPPLSLGENIIENISLYPNPASGYVNIKSLQGANIEVYNVVGKLVKSEKTLSNEHLMNVSELSSGIYLVKLTSEGKTATKKLIIK